MRGTAARLSCENAPGPAGSTTESSSRRSTCCGYLAAYPSATFVPYETPNRVILSTPTARRTASMSSTESRVV